jgi:hypothetical protein
MSRVGAGDVVVVKPANNVYTVMVIVATLVQVLALTVLVVRYNSVFGAMIFKG